MIAVDWTGGWSIALYVAGAILTLGGSHRAAVARVGRDRHDVRDLPAGAVMRRHAMKWSVLTLAVLALAGCGESEEKSEPRQPEEVGTFFDDPAAKAVAVKWAERMLRGPVDCRELSRDSSPNTGVAPYYVCTVRGKPTVRESYCQMTIYSHPTPEAGGRVDGWCDG